MRISLLQQFKLVDERTVANNVSLQLVIFLVEAAWSSSAPCKLSGSYFAPPTWNSFLWKV
jgi:hypothetical protein